jgi:hypothetical protein
LNASAVVAALAMPQLYTHIGIYQPEARCCEPEVMKRLFQPVLDPAT